jgi:hemolysin III
MIEHLSFDTFWKPKVTHKTFGGFWTSVYCFHMRHHYNIDCNEGISAFFGIPIPDFVFGTYAPWPRAFEHNEKVVVEEFVSSPPKPVAVIVWLDKLFV